MVLSFTLIIDMGPPSQASGWKTLPITQANCNTIQMDKSKLRRDMLSIVPGQQAKFPPKLKGVAKLTPHGVLLSSTSPYRRQSNTFEASI